MADPTPYPGTTAQRMSTSERKILADDSTPYELRESTWQTLLERVGAAGKDYRWPDWSSITFYTYD